MFLILGYTTTLSLCPYNFFVHQLLYQSLNKPKQKKKTFTKNIRRSHILDQVQRRNFTWSLRCVAWADCSTTPHRPVYSVYWDVFTWGRSDQSFHVRICPTPMHHDKLHIQPYIMYLASNAYVVHCKFLFILNCLKVS